MTWWLKMRVYGEAADADCPCGDVLTLTALVCDVFLVLLHVWISIHTCLEEDAVP
jgi:hypothetical protein